MQLRQTYLTIYLLSVINCTLSLPHLIVIIADDLGWYNIQWRNNETINPNLISLTSEGLLLNRHYTYKFCSPTRSSFLSGRLPIHVNQQNREVWEAGGGVHLNMTMLPQRLKKQNYKTHQLGKWHAGMSSVTHLPISRGFDSSFGYLGGAEDHYRQRQGDGVDLWNSTKPAYGRNGSGSGDDAHYGDAMYREEALHIINNHDIKYPLFMYFAAQIAHDPQQVPDAYEKKYPSKMFSQRKTYAAMTTYLDETIGLLVATLKSRSMWENTFMVFFADNGGPTGVNSGSANNYPLRGGKHSDFEGGVRTNAMVLGGILPVPMRSRSIDGYIHVCDWYATLLHLANINDSSDHHPGVPDTDSLNVWPLLSGANATSPRMEIPLSASAIIQHEYKLVKGDQRNLGFWTGPQTPNGTKHYKDAGCTKNNGCLFNIIADPTEHQDLAKKQPDLVDSLNSRLNEIKKSIFQTDGNCKFTNSKAAAEKVKSEQKGFWGPYGMDTCDHL